MGNLKGKRVLIFQQRGWAINIGHFLAKKIQAEGCRLGTLTLKRTTHEFITEQKEVKYDFIISIDDLKSKPYDYLQGDKFSLQEICNDLGIDSIWPFVASIRTFMRSYGDKYYYGFKQNVSDEGIIDYIMALYKCLKFVFDEFKPDVILTPNFVTFHHIVFNLMAEKKGIKMIGVVDSKIKSYYLFTHDYNNNKGTFYERVDELNAGKADTENRDRAREYIQEFRRSIKQPDGFVEYIEDINRKKPLKRRVRSMLAPYYQTLRWYIKGPSKNYLANTGISIDYKPPRIIFRDYYCNKQYKKFADNFNYYPLDKINKCIYLPLQHQPEATIDLIAPYFSNQIEIARQIAMSLPNDYTLVVKEHPSMVNLRPPSYIEKIARTPNVKLIDYRIMSEEVLKKADLIVSPNSTTIVEAAFLKKPAIQLGNLGTTLKLPNTFKHTDMTTLSARIKEVLKINLETEEYERRLENFVAAVYDTGFDFPYEIFWAKGKGSDTEVLWQIYKKEIKQALIK